MSGLNKVMLIGNVGSDIEQRPAGKGTLTSFSFATSKKIKDSTITEWHNIVIWNKLGNLAKQYLKKGDKVYLEGEIKYNKWEDKEHKKDWKSKWEDMWNKIRNMLKKKGKK